MVDNFEQPDLDKIAPGLEPEADPAPAQPAGQPAEKPKPAESTEDTEAPQQPVEAAEDPKPPQQPDDALAGRVEEAEARLEELMEERDAAAGDGMPTPSPAGVPPFPDVYGGQDLASLDVPGVGKTISVDRPSGPRGLQQGLSSIPNGFWAIITHAESHVVEWSWLYSWAELEKLTAGYHGWSVKDGGLFGTHDTAEGELDKGPGYNTVEDLNVDTGLVGSGIDVDGLVTDEFEFFLMPAPVGAIVWMRAKTFVTAAGVPLTEYWFQFENAADGGCTEA